MHELEMGPHPERIFLRQGLQQIFMHACVCDVHIMRLLRVANKVREILHYIKLLPKNFTSKGKCACQPGSVIGTLP
jgi:hypothetical protein